MDKNTTKSRLIYHVFPELSTTSHNQYGGRIVTHVSSQGGSDVIFEVERSGGNNN